MRLGELVAAAAEVAESVLGLPDELAHVEVTGVVHDARDVVEGSLFCCVPGENVDGHDLAPVALANGAAALVVQRRLPLDAPQIGVGSVRDVMGPLASAFWGHPSHELDVVGVTGTSGKTTTTHLLGAVLTHAGRSTEVMGTLSGPRTTPEATELQAQLATAVSAGRSAVAMEVSSHTLSLGRVRSTRFTIAVFTNLSVDHLDFHADLEDYFAAKAQLFRPDLTDRAVVNADDRWGRRLLEDPAVPTETFSLADADGLQIGADRCRFTWRGVEVALPFGGRFNVANALAAATTAAALGLTPGEIAAGLAEAPPVPGRFEPVVAGQPFAVLVDFAHKPGALESALVAARDGAGAGRVIVVFGAGGERDASKRPQMGEVAARLADRVLLTSDNPRGEDPLAIIEAVRSGMPEGFVASDALTVEPDRAHTIALAVADALPGDVVLIAGRGHETVQILATGTVPFDDRVVARAALQELGGSGRW